MLGRFEELLVILVIILVLFGGKKLPELARSIGTSVKEIRKGFAGDDTAGTGLEQPKSEVISPEREHSNPKS